MAAGDLTNYILASLAAARGEASLNAGTRPSRTQGIAWANRAQAKIQRRLLPRRLENGLWTAGRLDKLTKTLNYEQKTDGADTGGMSQISLPSTSPGIAFYNMIALGTGSGVSPGRPVDYEKLLFYIAQSTTIPTTEPVYAFGNGKLCALPTGLTYAAYYYLESPATMTDDVNEDWGLDDDLMPLAVHYCLCAMWSALGDVSTESAGLMQLHHEVYEAGMKLLLGEEYLQPEPGVR